MRLSSKSSRLARKKDRIKKRNAKVLYTQKKNDKFVVIRERIPAELKCMRKRQKKRSWSDLPPELLLSEVISRLSSCDEIRLRAVCKNWRKLFSSIHRTRRVIADHDLPWLLAYHWKDDQLLGLWEPIVLVCKLFDSSHTKPYSIDQVIGQDILRVCLKPDILASKHGWLILSWTKPFSRGVVMSYFLFSPFTKQIITLPHLNHESYALTHKTTFSTSDPCSPGCVFFVVRELRYDRILISTCRSHDTSWTTQEFEGYQIGIADVLFYGGLLFCLFDDTGALAAFEIANRSWSIVTTGSNLGGLSLGTSHLFECEGQLLFAYLNVYTSSDLDNGQCRLFSFSQSQRAWFAETSFLANKVLFLDDISSFAVSASGETTNKVYYHSKDGTLRFYSFDDGKAHTLVGSCYAGWLAAKGRNKRTLIQPPRLFPKTTRVEGIEQQVMRQAIG